MASTAFNAFQAARALESAGVERTQAEAIARAIQQGHIQDQATRADMAELGSQLRTTIADIRAEVRGSIDGLGAEVPVATSDIRTCLSQLRTDMAGFEKRTAIRLYVGGAGLAAWIIAFELFA